VATGLAVGAKGYHLKTVHSQVKAGKAAQKEMAKQPFMKDVPGYVNSKMGDSVSVIHDKASSKK